MSHLDKALQASPVPDFLANPESLKAHIEKSLDFLYTSRPTAVNLGAATRRLRTVLHASVAAGRDPKAVAQDLIAEGKVIDDEDVSRNRAMAKWGAEWLLNEAKPDSGSGERKVNVMTVCNTGSLATSVR